jgi:hypothetical protein
MSSSAIFDKDVLLAMIIGLLGIYILHVDSSTPAVNNYGEPIKISATEEKDIIIELVSNPTSLSKYSNEHTIISFLSYNDETFRCSCPRNLWCNDDVYKNIKKIRLRSATIRIADSKIKIRHIGGKRHCRIIEWEYLLQKDKDLIETLNKMNK